MKLIVGIGNPGLEYLDTWHNAGIVAIKKLKGLQDKGKFPKNVVLKESDEFMNNSGEFVLNLVKKYNINPQDLFVIHDDLDIKLGGGPKIQFGKGPKDHNGLKSIDEALGSNQYWHVRVGVDNRPMDNRVMGEEYVLQSYNKEEKEMLNKTIEKIAKELLKKFKSQ